MSDLVRNSEDRFSNNEAQTRFVSFWYEERRPIHNEETNEPRHEKTNVLVSDLVRHKPGCTATEDGQRLEISDLESRGDRTIYVAKQRR